MDVETHGAFLKADVHPYPTAKDCKVTCSSRTDLDRRTSAIGRRLAGRDGGSNGRSSLKADEAVASDRRAPMVRAVTFEVVHTYNKAGSTSALS